MNSVSYALHLREDVTHTSSRNDFKERDRRSRSDDLEILFKPLLKPRDETSALFPLSIVVIDK